MALSKEVKAQILADYATKEGDTGSVEVTVGGATIFVLDVEQFVKL